MLFMLTITGGYKCHISSGFVSSYNDDDVQQLYIQFLFCLFLVYSVPLNISWPKLMNRVYGFKYFKISANINKLLICFMGEEQKMANYKNV